MNSRRPNTILVSKLCVQLTDDPQKQYSEKWICDESWFRIMNEKFPNLSQAFNFRRTDVSKQLRCWLVPSINRHHLAFCCILCTQYKAMMTVGVYCCVFGVGHIGHENLWFIVAFKCPSLLVYCCVYCPNLHTPKLHDANKSKR